MIWGKFRLLALGLLLAAVCAPAQTLERLEAILSHYSSLEAFLADSKGLADYKKAYQIFLGDTDNPTSADSFDQVWEKFLGQLREANEKVPGFGAQVWQLNEKWRESEFQLKGESKGSGLVGKREPLLAEIEKLFQDVVEETKSVIDAELQGDREVERLVNELKEKYGVRSPDELKLLSRPEAKAYAIRIGGDKKKHQLGLADDPSAKTLAAYLVRRLLGGDEGLRDFLLSGDPDMTHNGLERLRKLESFAEVFKRWNLREVNEILPYLKFSSARLDTLESDYQRGLESVQAIRHIKDARPSADLLLRLQELNGQGVRGDKVRANLSEPLQKSYDEWALAAADVSALKRQVASGYQSPFFQYSLVEDPVRKTTRLQSDAPLALTYVASPRPFHLLLAGRKNRECVGGGQCQNLVVKRWARAALHGDRSLFSLNSDRSMEGFVGLTQVKNEKDLDQSWILDLGSRATKGEIVLRNAEGRPVKYTFFDALIDRLSQTTGANPKPRFIISDGNTVSANVAGSDLLHRSQAFNERRIVGTPGDFTPMDPMAAKIADVFPQTLHEYGGGGLIFDGMKNDGHEVFHLVPQSDRRRWQKAELEYELYFRALSGKPVEDWIWMKAFESGVRLEPAKHYQDDAHIGKFFGRFGTELAQRYGKGRPEDGLEEALARLRSLDGYAKAIRGDLFIKSGLRDVLARKAIQHSGTKTAASILSLSGMDATSPELVLQALLKNLNPSYPERLQEIALRRLSEFAGMPENYPRLGKEDVLTKVIEVLKGPLPTDPQNCNPLYYAATFVARAIEEQPKDKRFVTAAIMDAVTLALKTATSHRSMENHLGTIRGLIGVLTSTLQSHPTLGAPISEENISSVERRMEFGNWIEEGGMQIYTKEALASHPENPRLLTSSLVVFATTEKLLDALSNHPTELRLHHLGIWNRLRDILAESEKSDARKAIRVLGQLLERTPDSTVFKTQGIIKELRNYRVSGTSPIMAHIIRQNPADEGELGFEFKHKMFLRDHREEMRAILDTNPESHQVGDLLREKILSDLYEKLNPDFLRWLFRGQLGPLLQVKTAAALGQRFAIDELLNNILQTELLSVEEKFARWHPSLKTTDPGQTEIFVARYKNDYQAKAEEFLMKVFGDAIAQDPEHSSAVGVAVELAKFKPESYLARIAQNALIQSEAHHPFIAEIVDEWGRVLSSHANHPFIPTYLNDIEAALTLRKGWLPRERRKLVLGLAKFAAQAKDPTKEQAQRLLTLVKQKASCRGKLGEL